jgi:hypothetical protein
MLVAHEEAIKTALARREKCCACGWWCVSGFTVHGVRRLGAASGDVGLRWR